MRHGEDMSLIYPQIYARLFHLELSSIYKSSSSRLNLYFVSEVFWRWAYPRLILNLFPRKMDNTEARECEAISQSEFMSSITTLTGPTGSGLATLGLHHGQGRQTEVENVGMDVAWQLIHLQYSTARQGHLLPSTPETGRCGSCASEADEAAFCHHDISSNTD